MTDPTLSADPRADIAFLKRMAMDGRGEPAPALVLMAVFGLVYGLIALALHLQLQGTPAGEPFVASPAWLTFNRYAFPVGHLALLIALVWTGWRLFAGDRRPLSRGALAVWSGAFLGLVVTIGSILTFTRTQLPTDAVYAVFLTPTILLTLWGVAWWTTAIASRRPWLTVIAVASWIMAGLAAWVGNSPPMLLIAATSLLGLAFLPAVILMARPHT